MFNIIKLLILLAILVLGAALASINEGQVTLDYYFGTLETPVALALLGAMGVGLLLGFFAGLMLWAKARAESGKLRRSARLAQEEVNNLRAIPLKQQ